MKKLTILIKFEKSEDYSKLMEYLIDLADILIENKQILDFIELVRKCTELKPEAQKTLDSFFNKKIRKVKVNRE